MCKMILNFIILILLITPISLLFHELGHLLGAKYLKADRVVISIGSGKKMFSCNFNEMSIKIYLMSIFQADNDSDRQAKFNNKELALMIARRPLLSAVLTVF